MSGQYKSSDTVELVLSEGGQGDESDCEYDTSRRFLSKKEGSSLKVLCLLLLLLLVAFTLSLALTSDSWFGNKDSEQELIVGLYRLESFGPDFDEYLLSLNIPKHVIPLIRNTSETVEIWGPREDASNGTWTITLTTDYGEHTLRFQLGRKFQVSHHEDSSSLHHLCTRPEPNVLDCRTEALARGWSIRSLMRFSSNGFVEEISNMNTEVRTRKNFARIAGPGKKGGDEHEKEEDMTTKEPMDDLEMDIWEY